VTCTAALLLALGGARLRRPELVWLAYGGVGLGTVKIVVEDLRLGTTTSFAASLLIYGTVLILIPRLARTRQ
jgi:hypothetical protein